MIISKPFYNAKCDSCGSLLDDEQWWDVKEGVDTLLHGSNWIEVGGKHYCPDCYSYDDEDNLEIMEVEKNENH